MSDGFLGESGGGLVVEVMFWNGEFVAFSWNCCVLIRRVLYMRVNDVDALELMLSKRI